MVLNTQLSHIDSEEQFRKILSENTNVMVCCGRMGPMCVPVYSAMEILREKYSKVAFCDMAFDHPEAHVIRDLPECKGFMGLPFTVYFKNGKVVEATSSIQTQEQVEAVLRTHF